MKEREYCLSMLCIMSKKDLSRYIKIYILVIMNKLKKTKI